MKLDEQEKEPWLARAFPTVVRYSGLGISLWLILSGRVAPEVGLAFAGSMITGSLWIEDKIRGRK